MKIGRQTSIEFALLTIGLILSTYLLFHHYEIRLNPSKESFCTLSADINCDVVALHSSSEVLGIPLAVYGTAFYLLLFWLLRITQKTCNSVLAAYSKVLKGLGLIISVYLFIVSKWVIGSLCLVCCATYLVNLGLVGLSALTAEASGWKSAILSVFEDIQVKG